MNEFGREFPDEASMASVHLWCYRHHIADDPDMLTKHEHFKAAIDLLFPEKFSNGETGFVWSEWEERRSLAWVTHEYQTWWGCAASGKSTSAAVYALMDWISAPNETTVTVCSTSLEALRQRIWREILRYHGLLRQQDPSVFGNVRRQPPMLSYEPEEQDGQASTINAMFGIAIPEGDDENAMRNAFGKHNRYNILILDEMQMMHPAAANAYDNISTGGIENKFLGMGNPWSRLDGLGKASEPKDGWNSISPEMEQWETKKGVCLYFDGLKSPGIKDPKKYHFLLCQKDIDSMMVDPGPDSPRFWSQRRGFCPPEGLVETVLSENFISKFNMKDSINWRDRPRYCAGLDPSFSAGGDKAVYTPAKVGLATNGKQVIQLLPPENINLQLTQDGEPLVYVLAHNVIEKLIRDGITPSDLTIDTTGAQRALADIIDIEWQQRMKDNKDLGSGRCHRLSFGGKASDKPLNMQDDTPCCELYGNKVTELWMMMREFGLNDQIRGLSDQAAIEFCMRTVLGSIKGGRIVVEPKSEMKVRTAGHSPDTADSNVCVIEHVRFMIGIIPGGDALKDGSVELMRLVHDLDVESSEELYQEEETFGEALDLDCF